MNKSTIRAAVVSTVTAGVLAAMSAIPAHADPHDGMVCVRITSAGTIPPSGPYTTGWLCVPGVSLADTDYELKEVTFTPELILRVELWRPPF